LSAIAFGFLEMLLPLLWSERASRSDESVQHNAGLLKLYESRSSLIDIALLLFEQSFPLFALLLEAVSLTVSLFELILKLSNLGLLLGV